jgi:hypothetical protein
MLREELRRDRSNVPDSEGVKQSLERL